MATQEEADAMTSQLKAQALQLTTQDEFINSMQQDIRGMMREMREMRNIV